MTARRFAWIARWGLVAAVGLQAVVLALLLLVGGAA
jgi:hypothetical protein